MSRCQRRYCQLEGCRATLKLRVAPRSAASRRRYGFPKLCPIPLASDGKSAGRGVEGRDHAGMRAVHDVRPGESEQMVSVASLARLQVPRRADVLLPARRGETMCVERVAVDCGYRPRALKARGRNPGVFAA